MKKTSVAVIGIGGVGGYFGFKLARTYSSDPDVTITFVARGDTYQILSQQGLTLYSPEHAENNCHPDALAADVRLLENTDVFLVCVKEYDLEQVCIDLQGKIHDQSILLPLMNGADIYERMRRIPNKGIILPACVYVASHIQQKGVIVHKGKSGKIMIGKDPLHPAFVPTDVFELLHKAGIDITYHEDAFPLIWTKFFFIASFGLVSACYNKSMGEILEEPAMHDKAAAIMAEIQAIAAKKGIVLPEDIIQQTFAKAGTFPYGTPTSLQLDIQAKKEKNELELFAGTIIQYGETYGVSVKATEAIYRQICENLMQ